MSGSFPVSGTKALKAVEGPCEEGELKWQEATPAACAFASFVNDWDWDVLDLSSARIWLVDIVWFRIFGQAE
jgi:hypothetical protein